MTDVTDDAPKAESPDAREGTEEPSAREATATVAEETVAEETVAEEAVAEETAPETSAEAAPEPDAETAPEAAPEPAAAADGAPKVFAAPEPDPEPDPDPLDAVRAERDKLKEQLLRTAADFDNFRKRALRDLEDARRRTREDALREVLPVIDNLERASAASENATEVKAVAEGVQMVLKGFEEVAGRLGLKRISSVGQRFDPNVHDAVQQMESADQEPGTIVAEVVPGYSLGERLLRPAMVVVAKKPAAPAEDA